MENKELQAVNQSLSLSDKEVTIARLLLEVNMLLPYPIGDKQISDWTRSINRLMPDLDINRLAAVLDDFKMDKIEWDNKKGIQNIFNAIQPKGYSPDTTN